MSIALVVGKSHQGTTIFPMSSRAHYCHPERSEGSVAKDLRNNKKKLSGMTNTAP
jgi:hypothetical protein